MAVDGADRNGTTALMLAATAGRLAAAEALFAGGADVALRDAQGKSAADMARDMGHGLLALAPGKAGRPGARPTTPAPTGTAAGNSRTTTTSTPSVAVRGQPAAAPSRTLRPAGASDREKLLQLRLMLHRAGMAKEMRHFGKDSQGNHGWLMSAAHQGNASLPWVLCRLGAGVNDMMPDGLTPPMIAARQGHSATVQALLDAHAEINRLVSSTDGTALIAAVESRHIDSAKILLAAGAEVDRGRQHGYRPYLRGMAIPAWCRRCSPPAPRSITPPPMALPH